MVKALFGLFFFITQFPSLNFRHSSLITHHSKYYTRLAHHSISITQYFSHYLWVPYLSLIAGFFFFLPKLTEPSEKRERERETQNIPKKRKETQNRPKWKKKKKELNSQEESKKKKVKSCSWYYLWVPFCVFNYNIAIELWVMETENTF